MQALSLGEQNKEAIRVDKLQKLHTLHNLDQLLKGGAHQLPGVPRTLRDSELSNEAQRLRDGYLAESIAKLAAADREYQDALTAMNTAAEQQSTGVALPATHILTCCLHFLSSCLHPILLLTS